MNPPSPCREAAAQNSPSQIRNRLIQLVGEYEAYELLESPNADLDGLTPQSLLDVGDTSPVQTLLETLEIRERARIVWLSAYHPEPLAVENLLTADERRGKEMAL
jgi:hypothetical protein